MKTLLFALAAAGAVGLALAPASNAEAGDLRIDVHVGLPAVVHAPRVVYRPAVVYHQPRVIYESYAHRHYHKHRPAHHDHHRTHRHGARSVAAARPYEHPRALGRIGPASRLHPQQGG